MTEIDERAKGRREQEIAQNLAAEQLLLLLILLLLLLLHFFSVHKFPIEYMIKHDLHKTEGSCGDCSASNIGAGGFKLFNGA